MSEVALSRAVTHKADWLMYESVAREKPTMYNRPPRANSAAERLLSLKLDKDNIL